jgi:hypothetical protein
MFPIAAISLGSMSSIIRMSINLDKVKGRTRSTPSTGRRIAHGDRRGAAILPGSGFNLLANDKVDRRVATPQGENPEDVERAMEADLLPTRARERPMLRLHCLHLLCHGLDKLGP